MNTIYVCESQLEVSDGVTYTWLNPKQVFYPETKVVVYKRGAPMVFGIAEVVKERGSFGGPFLKVALE